MDMVYNSERDERLWNQWTDAEDDLLVELAEKRKTRIGMQWPRLQQGIWEANPCLG